LRCPAGGVVPEAAPAAARPVPFRDATADTFETVRTLLRDAGFTEPGVCRRLDAASVFDLKTVSDGRGETPVVDALDVLVRLFLDERPVPASSVRGLLGERSVALEALGLLEPDGDDLAATVLLYPVGPVLIASDRIETGADVHADIVYPAITRSGRAYLMLQPRTPVERFLELCGGTGVAALLNAAGSAHVWTTDIAERSTRFARFNARLNGFANVTAATGDLFEPVRGLTFDRIVTHPPYGPALEQALIYRDGGQDGEQISRRIFAEAPAYLRPGGRLYCTAMLTDRTDGPIEQRVRARLGAAGGECDVLVVAAGSEPPATSFLRQSVGGPRTPPATAAALADAFERLGVKALVGCTVVVQRPATPRPVFTARRRRSQHMDWRDVERLLWWESLRADPAFPERLRRARPTVAPGVRLEMEGHLRSGRFVGDLVELRTDRPVPAVIRVPLAAADLLARCDGATAVDRLIADLALPADAAFELAASLLGGGFLDADL
jgi:methylase of polypeptide subunit release factors